MHDKKEGLAIDYRGTHTGHQEIFPVSSRQHVECCAGNRVSLAGEQVRFITA